MKKIYFLVFVSVLVVLFSCKKAPAPKQNSSNGGGYTVTVNNGYGSGTYNVGDTVNIFSNPCNNNQLFDKWTGNTALLQHPNEWHTWFIMPSTNVTVTSNIKNIQSFSLVSDNIMGRDRLKPVYYYFPTGQKGVVYLLHGTGGNAQNIVTSYEWYQIIKQLVDDNFGVIITEAEESTTGVDANGDGKIRWTLIPSDTVNNVDFANISIITDTLCNRGLMSWSEPRYSIGMSDGGFFSAALAHTYHFKASVQYCSQGSPSLMQITTIPTQFCMARNDQNPSVGSQGDADALSYSQDLNSRGVCSQCLFNERSPIYPERFATNGDISVAQSQDIFNELKAQGYIDNNNYFIGYSDALVTDVQDNPSHFPIIKSLSFNQLQAMLSQINIAVADHHIFSDYSKATVNFLDNFCQ